MRVAALYGTLARIGPSPVVELNHAVALGMAFGPSVGALLDEPSLREHHLRGALARGRAYRERPRA